MSEKSAAEHVVGALLEAMRGETPRGATVTWMNHYSVLQEREGTLSDQFDFVGIDGVFLCKLLGLNSTVRTSADVVVPKLLAAGAFESVALIGGAPGVAESKVEEVRALCRHPDQVYVTAWDGFGELGALRENLEAWHAYAGHPQVIVLGLGAPLQNEVALAMSSALSSTLILTCGGWLDQVGTDYYPGWAYPLRLNWLVRLTKEPKRLAARYSLDAIRALKRRNQIRSLVEGLPGYVECLKVSAGGTTRSVTTELSMRSS